MQHSPYHAKTTLSLYSLGLGVNSMHHREQKHQRLKQNAENTKVCDFQTSFSSTYFLREMDMTR